MHEPKILIRKKVILDDKGHFRFRSPMWVPNKERKKNTGYSVIFALNPKTDDKRYQKLFLNTEKELIVFLKKTFGNGEYLIVGYAKNHKGLWSFWRGDVSDEGWMMANKNYDRRDVDKLEKQLFEASKNENDQESIESLNEEIKDVKEIEKEIVKDVRYGFLPFLRPSGKRGVFHGWDEQDEGYVNKPKSVKKNVDTLNMSVDDINAF